MALYGVVSAIHGNAEALAAALAALERRGATRLICLGDIVGYNADPDECVQLLRAKRATSIAGKHDLMATGRLDLERCPPRTQYSLRRTRQALSRPAAQWLASLAPCQPLDERIVLAHGGVRDPQQYMTHPRDLRQNAGFLATDFPTARLCFFGNSHARRVARIDADDITELRADAHSSTVQLDRNALFFVNPGAVDAQRRREHRLAECALFDSLEWTVEFLRVRYDAASTEAKAAVFGYRINGLAEGIYGLRRRLAFKRAASTGRAGRAA